MNIWQKLSIRTFLNNISAKRTLILFAALIFILFLSFIAAVLFGSTDISLKDIISSVISGNKSSAAYRIAIYVRLPRALGAVLCGSALAVSGTIIQAALNNAMAGPNIIGVNSGAGLMSILVISLLPDALFLMPFAALTGAFFACLIIYFIASKTGAGKASITLVGIAVSSILSAGINTVKTLFPDSIYNSSYFFIGGLSGINFNLLKIAAPVILIALIITILISGNIDILSLGEETAHSLGLNVSKTRFTLLLLASALAGGAVSFAGLLGFVGLIVPHIVRRIFGTRHRLIIPVCAISGAVLVLLCDLLSRIIFSPYEIPVGVIMSFIGGPFFITLIITKRNSKIYD